MKSATVCTVDRGLKPVSEINLLESIVSPY
jgi:hypothetical protein